MFTNTQLLKTVPRIWNNSDLIGELIVQNGQLLIKNGGSYTVVSGGSSIAANTWYTISVEVDPILGKYSAWVGTKSGTIASYNLLVAANAVSSVSYSLTEAETNGMQIDYLKIGKVNVADVGAPLSSIARVTTPNDYYVVTDQGNTGGTITVYTNTTVNNLKSRLTAMNGGSFAVTGKPSGTAVIATNDTLMVTSADGTTTRSYVLTSTVNTHAFVYSIYDAVIANNTLHTISGVESDTSVDVFRGIIETAKNASYIIKDQANNVKTTGVILGTDTISVTAESGAVQTYTISLLPDNIVVKYYVNPVGGSDANNGAIGTPFQTIDKARITVNGVKGSTNGDIAIYLRGGTYTLTTPLTFSSDSGVNGHSIIYKAYGGESVSLSGGEAITGWTVDKTVGSYTVYKANAHSLNFAQLYVNDKPATRSRFPNAGTYNLVKDWDLANGTIKVNSSEVPTFVNNASNPVVVRAQARWIDIFAPIRHRCQRALGLLRSRQRPL